MHSVVHVRKLILLALACCCLASPHRSNGQIDSLLEAARSAPSDSVRVRIYNELGFLHWNTQPLEGVEYGLRAFRLADSIGYRRGVAEAQKTIGVCYWSMGSYDPALRALLDGLSVATEIGDDELVCRMEHNIALVHEDMGNIEQAIYYYRKNLDWYQQRGKRQELPRVFNNLGTAYFQRRMLDSALANYHRALSIPTIGEDADLARYIFINLSEAYLAKSDRVNSKVYLDKAVDEYTRVNDKSGLMECYAMLGKLSLSNGQLEEARTHLSKAWSLASEGKFTHYYANLMKGFASLDSARGNFRSAFLNYQKAVAWQDSILNFKRKAEYERMLIQYRTDQKEKENEMLKQANVISQLTIRNNQRVMVIVIISSIAILSLIIYFFYKRAQYRTQLEASELQHILREERERIAQDLHDNIGSQLTSLSLGLKKLGKSGVTDGEGMKQLNDGISDTMAELRDTIWAINREEVTIEQVIDKIRNMVWRLRQTAEGIQYDLDIKVVNEQLALKPIQAINLFRVVQEAINNSTRHSGASLIRIRVINEGKELRFFVEDDGRGFVEEKQIASDHYGLRNMRRRAGEIGATLIISSTPGKGTVIELLHLFA